MDEASALSPHLLIGDLNAVQDFSITLTDDVYRQLKHRVRYWGGPWDLTVFLPDSLIPTAQLDEWFAALLMNQMAEYVSGAVPWRGVIWEMERTKDGAKKRRSMSDVWNAVKCIYTLTGSSEQLETAWQTNDDSIGRYLRRELIVYKDNCNLAEAEEKAQSELGKAYDSWPKTTNYNTTGEDGLLITGFGLWRLFNNIYCTVTTPNEMVRIDDFVTDIFDTNIAPNFSFITMGQVDTNAETVQREQRAPARCGDLIDRLARVGDPSIPIPYHQRVGADAQFMFSKFNSTPVMEWNGRLGGGLTMGGGGKATWTAMPGVVEDKTAPSVPALAGSFLQKRNHELVEQFSMWQGRNEPTPELETPDEDQLLADVDAYQRWATDGNFDTLHTPGSTL